MTEKLRREAALFYYTQPTGAIQDWIEGRSDGHDIDPDVHALAKLLTVTANTAYERSAEVVKQLSHEDGLGMGSQRIEQAILGLRVTPNPVETARGQWVRQLAGMPGAERVREVRQMLHDALDLVEKTDHEQPVLAAFNAIEGKLI